MRKVRVPAGVEHEVALMRRRASRCGHLTGRSLVLKSLAQEDLWRQDRFLVHPYVVCSACGQEFPVCRAPLPQCRGHR